MRLSSRGITLIEVVIAASLLALTTAGALKIISATSRSKAANMGKRSSLDISELVTARVLDAARMSMSNFLVPGTFTCNSTNITKTTGTWGYIDEAEWANCQTQWVAAGFQMVPIRSTDANVFADTTTPIAGQYADCLSPTIAGAGVNVRDLSSIFYCLRITPSPGVNFKTGPLALLSQQPVFMKVRHYSFYAIPNAALSATYPGVMPFRDIASVATNTADAPAPFVGLTPKPHPPIIDYLFYTFYWPASHAEFDATTSKFVVSGTGGWNQFSDTYSIGRNFCYPGYQCNP